MLKKKDIFPGDLVEVIESDDTASEIYEVGTVHEVEMVTYDYGNGQNLYFKCPENENYMKHCLVSTHVRKVEKK